MKQTQRILELSAKSLEGTGMLSKDCEWQNGTGLNWILCELFAAPFEQTSSCKYVINETDVYIYSGRGIGITFNTDFYPFPFCNTFVFHLWYNCKLKCKIIIYASKIIYNLTHFPCASFFPSSRTLDNPGTLPRYKPINRDASLGSQAHKLS